VAQSEEVALENCRPAQTFDLPHLPLIGYSSRTDTLFVIVITAEVLR
jgi:hypothetical protein